MFNHISSAFFVFKNATMKIHIFIYSIKFAGGMTINYQLGLSNRIEHISGENETVISNQLGHENRFSAQSLSSQSVATMICNQRGEDNKIIINLDNQTSKYIDIEAKGGK